MASELFEDIFEVRQVNPDGKKFDKGVSYELELTLDINSEVYRLRQNEKFTFALVSTLDLEGKPDDGTYNQSGKPTLLDRYDYGMYGKVFQYDHEGGNVVAIYASFGGLLMCLRGEQRHLHMIHNDTRIYCSSFNVRLLLVVAVFRRDLLHLFVQILTRHGLRRWLQQGNDLTMGGTSAAAAYASSANAGGKEDTRRRLNASYDENEQILDDEYDEQDEEEERERAAERAEMRKHFNFPVQKQRATLKNHLMSAMQKKRRLLMRNENLHSRELYKPPEPVVLIIATSLVTTVSLILSKSMKLGELELLQPAQGGDPGEHAALPLDVGSPRGTLSWTPLQYACALGDDELVLSLLKDCKKEAVETTGKTGSTALHLAVLRDHLAILRLLLEVNAKLVPTKVFRVFYAIKHTKNGTTPLDIANELGHTEIAQLLVDHMQKDAGREQIGNWLANIGLVEYAANFHAASVDDARFLLSTGLSDSILDTMQITKPGHRMKLQSLYQLKESIPDAEEEEEGSSDNEEDEDSDDASSGSDEDDETDDEEDASSDGSSESDD
ncbi:putative Dna directed RNA polymerase i, partial [Globisporangium splendens]